jgi:hypothetical protein
MILKTKGTRRKNSGGFLFVPFVVPSDASYNACPASYSITRRHLQSGLPRFFGDRYRLYTANRYVEAAAA